MFTKTVLEDEKDREYLKGIRVYWKAGMKIPDPYGSDITVTS